MKSTVYCLGPDIPQMLKKWLLNESINQYLRIKASIRLWFFNNVHVFFFFWTKIKENLFCFFLPIHHCHFFHRPKPLHLAVLSHLPTCFCGWRGHHWLPGKELLPHFLLQLPAVVSNFLGENGYIHSSICIKMRSSSTLHHTLPFPTTFHNL